MSLPDAVKKAGERADKAAAALVAQREDVGEPTGQPAAQPDNVSQIQPQPTEQNPSPQPAQTAVTSDSEQRYKTLQGMYEADRQRWQRDAESKDSQITRLAETCADLTEQLQDMRQEAPAAQVAQMSYQDMGLSQDQIDEIGEDMLGVMRSMATNIASSVVGKVERRVDQVGQSVTQSAEDVFFSRLQESVPDWRVMNRDPGFLAWLKESDGLSSVTRQENLAQAHQNRDSSTAIRYFTTYKEAQNQGAAVDLAPATTPGQAPVNLAAQDQGPAPVRRSEIKAHYAAVASGRLIGDEAAAAEKRINAAVAAGRVLEG